LADNGFARICRRTGMEIQTLIALGILLLAMVYAANRFKRNWQKGDTNSKCEHCDIPDRINKGKSLKL